MKKYLITVVWAGTLLAAPALVAARQVDPDAHGVGVVKAIDNANGTVTLQHETIAAIGWPAMTMPFKLASLELLKNMKVGDKVTFTLHPEGMASTVTSIKLTQPGTVKAHGD